MQKKPLLSRKQFIWISIIAITSMHYLTPTQLHKFHDVYQRLYYIPIISAAVWYGTKHSIRVSVVISILYSLHIIFQWGWGGHAGHGMRANSADIMLPKFLEIVIFNLVALVTGVITDREKKIKDKYLQTAEKLKESYHKLKVQTKEMIDIEEQLRRADRLTILGQISAELAHEIRNPLGSIKGTVEIIKSDYSKDDKKYEFIEIMVKETNRLNEVLDNFLRFSKGKAQPTSSVNINSLLNEVMSFLNINITKNRVTLKIELKENLPMVILNGEQLKQVFFNIVINAIQSMPDGGTLSVKTDMESDKNKSYLTIAFIDTGVGIRDEDLDKLFEPFHTSKEEGTGLGLSISQKIIEKFGGQITINSVLGKGSTFTVKLPIKDEEIYSNEENSDNR